MKKLVLFAAAACLFAACAKETPAVTESSVSDTPSVVSPAPAPVFYASVESGTRTFLDGLDVCWAAEDLISIFNFDTFNSKYVYTGETGATKGPFEQVATGSNDVELPYVYAAYPYNQYSEYYTDDDALSLWFPPQQKYVEGSFDPAAGVMVAASESENLYFRNACGYLRVRLWGDNSAPVSLVYIAGNNGEVISGYRVVTVSPDDEPVSEPDTDYWTGTYVAVYDESGELYLGETSSEAVEFLMAIPPVNFTEGITIVVQDTDEGEFSFTTSTPLEIKRGVIKTTAPLEVTFTRPDWNYLGTGSLTDDICSVYSVDPTTVSCEVYEDAENPGIYKVTSFQKPLVEAVFGYDDLSDYEGTLYYDTGLVIDATDPDAVFFDYQDYGICLNTSDGFIGVTSTINGSHFSEGVLEDGVISFPTENGLLCTIGEEGYYYTNYNGAFKVVLPSAASTSSVPALAGKASGSADGRRLNALAKRPDIAMHPSAARSR